MPFVREQCGKVIVEHVAFLLQPLQELRDVPLRELGTVGRPGRRVNHPGAVTAVGVPAPKVAGVKPTDAAAAISTTAHARLPSETGAMIWHIANCCPSHDGARKR